MKQNKNTTNCHAKLDLASIFCKTMVKDGLRIKYGVTYTSYYSFKTKVIVMQEVYYLFLKFFFGESYEKNKSWGSIWW